MIDQIRQPWRWLAQHRSRVFLDETRAVVDKYKIVSTPTYLVIRGDGVVDSVFTGGAPILPALEAKKEELLGTASGS